MKDYVSITEATQVAGLSDAQVYALASNHKIKTKKEPKTGYKLFRVSDLETISQMRQGRPRFPMSKYPSVNDLPAAKTEPEKKPGGFTVKKAAKPANTNASSDAFNLDSFLDWASTGRNNGFFQKLEALKG